MAWLLLLALAALAAAVVLAARRGLAALQDSREHAWEALEAQLVKRQELMIRIVGLCSRLMRYERDALGRVSTAGSAVLAAARHRNMPALAAAEKSHCAASEALFRLAANYPQFGTSSAFRALRERAGILDARVAEKRERYNDAVSLLNFRCQAFPHNLVARTMGLEPAAFLS
jgi:LemA protein